MSVSMWRWTEECPMDECCGECDLCEYEPDEEDEDE